MTVTERVRETASGIKEDLRDTVEHLKDEVAHLKSKMSQLVPFRRRSSNIEVRQNPGSIAEPDRWLPPWGDPWFEAAWPSRFGHLLNQFDRDWGQWPQVDVTERDDEIHVRAELPGVEDEDVDVSLDGNVLSIRGEKRSENVDRGKDHHRHECYYGSFLRTIPLPCDVERDQVEARFRKGVLTVTLPKTRAARDSVRRIPVRRA